MSTVEKPTETLSPDNISAAINKLLEHPELLSMAASALGVSTPATATAEASAVTAESTTSEGIESPTKNISPDIMASIMPMLSKLSENGGSFKHEPLLRALKPYLSDSRREAIEYIIKISRMSSLVKGLK